ncbi:MAG: Kelch repeat-containing protein [Burkholderiales bacterium]
MIAAVKLLRWCLATAVSASFLAPAVHAQKWEKLAAPFPEASEELYGVAANGKFYTFGGLAPGWSPKGLMYEYDPRANKWTKKNNMPLALHHPAWAELNGKIYLFGGFVKPEKGPSAWVPINNSWEYDPANDSWKALAPLPTRRGAAAAAVVGGKIYVIGGASVHPGSKEAAVHPARPHRSVDTNEAYDPATDTWQSRQTMPTARNHAFIGVVNDKIYVLGGRVGAAFITRASNTGIVEEYDPATDQWGPLKASMPNPRSAGASGTFKGRIYTAGGEERSTGPWQRTFRAVEAFDPAANRWSVLPDMTYPRHGLAGDIVNGKFHLVSGDVASGAGPGAVIETDVHEVLNLEAK